MKIGDRVWVYRRGDAGVMHDGSFRKHDVRPPELRSAVVVEVRSDDAVLDFGYVFDDPLPFPFRDVDLPLDDRVRLTAKWRNQVLSMVALEMERLAAVVRTVEAYEDR